MGERATPKSLEHLRQALRSLPIRISRAILFGSRARGDYLEDSDWDVIIVSEDFMGSPFPERMSPLLLELTVSNVQMFCYTPEEFEEGEGALGIIGTALGEGVDLIVAESDAAV